ncbi:MAG: rod shape-determining protein MreC [Betaproteobacteria bacterium]
MALASLGRDPPPFFRQGPSALSRLVVFSALALLVMVADARFQMMQPVRSVIASVLYPVQWLAMQPLALTQAAHTRAASLMADESTWGQLQQKLSAQSLRANQVDQLQLENKRLRELLALQQRLEQTAVAAQVLYDAADPYSRKVVVDKGLVQGLRLGAPVLDELGVLGQVTRIFPLVSEVTLITDRDHATPVVNARTGARGVAYGETSSHADAMELRYMAANADVAVGDLLTTSGVDGVYPAGLPVARIEKIERRTDAVFARIYCVPLALVSGAAHVLVLDRVASTELARPAPEVAPKPTKTGGRR